MVELTVSVLLLVLLGFLCTNVYVIYIGRDYNDRICRESINRAAVAAMNGKDTDEVMRAARGGMYGCGIGGVFVEHPQFTAFSDNLTADKRIVRLQTRTLVHVPMDFLVLNPDYHEKRSLVFTSTYEYHIMNPKKTSNLND